MLRHYVKFPCRNVAHRDFHFYSTKPYEVNIDRKMLGCICLMLILDRQVGIVCPVLGRPVGQQCEQIYKSIFDTYQQMIYSLNPRGYAKLNPRGKLWQ